MAKSRAKKSSDEATAEAAAPAGEEAEQRPTRERKQVERYLVSYPTRTPAPKKPTIEQGPGEKLRDIPNVLFMMSKRKTDGNLNVLHTILFGRKSNVKYVKRNILQFSGFVWAGNEEKEKAKVKEKLEKCTKDKLLDFCELFDIPVNKWLTKKEEASEKLLEFLQSPYISRDVALEEKEQKGKKRKRTKEISQETFDEATSDKEEIKKQKKSSKTDAKNGRKQSSKADKDDEDGDEPREFEENDHGKSKPLSKKKSSEKTTVSGSPKTKEKISSANEGSTKSNKSTSQSIIKACSASQDESKAPARSKQVSINDPTRKGSKSAAKEKAALPEKESVKAPKKVSKSSKSTSQSITASQDEPKAPARSKQVSINDPTRKGSKSAAKEKAALPEKKSAKAPKKVSKSSKMSAAIDDSDLVRPSTSKSVKVDNKKGHDKPSTEGKKAIQNKTAKPKTSTKEKGKRKVKEKAIKGPSREDMLPVVADILKEVDFEVVTLADILKQLESHFKISLANRKGEVKSIIEEVINNMSDVEDIEEDEGNATDDNKGSDDNHVADKDDPEKEDPGKEEDSEEEEDPEKGSGGVGGK